MYELSETTNGVDCGVVESVTCVTLRQFRNPVMNEEDFIESI